MASQGPEVISPASLAAFRTVRNGPVIARAFAILLAYALLAVLAVRLWPRPWVLLPSAACGFLLSGFLNAAHDCVHATHLSRRKLNRIVGAAWCTPLLINFTLYKRQHLAHHRFTGVEGDTEEHAAFAHPASYLIAMTGVQFWRSIFLRILKTFRGDFPSSLRTPEHLASARTDNLVICLWLAGMVGLTVYFPVICLAGYWLPLLLYPPFAIFFSLPEHYGLTATPEGPKSRNVFTNPAVRLVQWNANFHATHHRAPSIPAVSLATFYRSTGVGRQDAEDRSYVGFHTAVIRESLRGSSQKFNHV